MEDSIKSEVENQVNILLTKKFHEILSPQIQEQFRLLQIHLVNANIGLSDMARIKETFTRPISINDASFTCSVNKMSLKIDSFKELVKSADQFLIKFEKYFLDESLIAKLSALDQAMSEIKYIGKRLKKIEDEVVCIKNDGVKRKINVCIYTDNLPVEKEECNEEKKDIDEEKEDYEKRFLSKLTIRQQFVLTHRCGLFGETPKTFDKIAQMEGVTNTRSREVYLKALRQLRKKGDISKNKLPEGRLKAVIFGEDLQT